MNWSMNKWNTIETEHANINKNTLRLLSTFNYKFNAQHKIESGVILSRLGYVANARSYNFDINEMEDVLKRRRSHRNGSGIHLMEVPTQ